jgi:DNA-binding CsgD family transcriptional regulator
MPRRSGSKRPRERESLPGLPLTVREVEIIRLVGRGLSNAEIAFFMGFKTNTAKSHLARISLKTGLRGRAALVDHAHRAGFMDKRNSPSGPGTVQDASAATVTVPEYTPTRVPIGLRTRARAVVPQDGGTPPELIALFTLCRRGVLGPSHRDWLRQVWNVLQEAAEMPGKAKENP